MLEEALSSPNYPPADVAYQLMMFVQNELPTGGSAAEARFSCLFPLLCVRVFGQLSGPNEGFRHLPRGWLSRDVRWERPLSSVATDGRMRNNNPIRSSSSSVRLQSDPVVKLLGCSNNELSTSSLSSSTDGFPNTLIDAISKEAEHRPFRYQFPFHAFPKHTQAGWLSILEVGMGPMSPQVTATSNATRLFGSLIRVSPKDQEQLLRYLQRKAIKQDQRRPLQLSPGYIVSPTNAGPSTPSKDNKDLPPPNVSFSMLEYYLLLFIRYPLAAPLKDPKQSQTPTGTTTIATTGRYNTGSPYPRPHVTIPRRKKDHYGESVYFYLFKDYARYFIASHLPRGHFVGFDRLPRESELFLRFVVEFWLNSQNELSPTNKVIEELQQFRRSMGSSVDSNRGFDLDRSFELTACRYVPNPYQVQRCLRQVVERVMLDGSLLDAACDYDVQGSPDQWCLSPCMTILQLPFYNYLRASFRHAPIHVSQSQFLAALQMWLIWLEPWNVRNISYATKRILDAMSSSSQKTKPQYEMSYPKPTHRSKYDRRWEPYIAANLHLYTVLLAIFLRRARELDFSAKSFHWSLTIIRKVFRVYSPEVIDCLNRLLDARQTQSHFSGLIAKHENNLGVHAPPNAALSLTSLQEDMRNLLEEIYIQHLKNVSELDFLDRLAARLEGLFGGGVVSGETAALAKLCERSKLIVNFPIDYEILPKRNASGLDEYLHGETDSSENKRTNGGLLSEFGLKGILVGADKCQYENIIYYNGGMSSRPQSFEISFLVPILIDLSTFLNEKLGLIPSGQSSSNEDDNESTYYYNNGSMPGYYSHDKLTFRINLRFLADYRILLFFSVIGFIWRIFK